MSADKSAPPGQSVYVLYITQAILVFGLVSGRDALVDHPGY
jgi:hypothetical protein